jgi:hypothetical protein
MPPLERYAAPRVITKVTEYTKITKIRKCFVAFVIFVTFVTTRGPGYHSSDHP